MAVPPVREPYEAKFQSGAVHVYDGNGDEVLTYTAGVGWHEKEAEGQGILHRKALWQALALRLYHHFLMPDNHEC